jgi:hypothetical protein
MRAFQHSSRNYSTDADAERSSSRLSESTPDGQNKSSVENSESLRSVGEASQHLSVTCAESSRPTLPASTHDGQTSVENSESLRSLEQGCQNIVLTDSGKTSCGSSKGFPPAAQKSSENYEALRCLQESSSLKAGETDVKNCADFAAELTSKDSSNLAQSGCPKDARSTSTHSPTVSTTSNRKPFTRTEREFPKVLTSDEKSQTVKRLRSTHSQAVSTNSSSRRNAFTRTEREFPKVLTSDEEAPIVKRLKKAVKQLEKQGTVLGHLMSDLQHLPRIQKTLVLPNLYRKQLRLILNQHEDLKEV